MGILLEICVASAEDAQIAERAGANRVELNSALMLGGLTPSYGTVIETMNTVKIPVITMIRPRAGGFCYSSSEFRVMLKDLEHFKKLGVHGVAFGFLKESGELDVERSQEFIKAAQGCELVFHRALDVVVNPERALEHLIELGVKRVMTSGREASAYNGISQIAAIIKQARGRIEVLPAGGINQFTLEDVVKRTGCTQVHASLSSSRKDLSTMARPQVTFGGTLAPPEDSYKVTSPKLVEEIKGRLESL